MKIPARVRFDVRVLVAWLTLFGPRGCWFKPSSGGAHSQKGKMLDVGRPRDVQWVRCIPKRDAFRTLMQTTDYWKSRTFHRAVQLGLVHAAPNREACIPGDSGFYPLTIDSRVRLSLTELGRAAYSYWALKNDKSVSDSASG